MTKTQLPRIVQFTNRTDSGEFGNDTCAHCGAKGRYQFHFICEDGQQHAAMAGCIKLFPVAPIAKIHSVLITKAEDLAKQHWPNGEQKKLNKWDATKLGAVEAFYRDEITEEQAIHQCRTQDVQRDDWMRQKGFKR